MRITLCSPFALISPFWGIEREIVQLSSRLVTAGHLVSLVTTDHAFRQLGPVPTEAVAALPGVQSIQVRGRLPCTVRSFQPSGAPLRTAPPFLRAVQHTRPDVVLIFNIGWPLTIAPVLFWARRCGVPALYRTAYHPPSGGRLGRSARRMVMLHTAGLAAILVCASLAEKRQLLCDGRLPHGRVRMLPYGSDYLLSHDDVTATLRQRLGGPASIVVCHVGRLGRDKGTDVLIRAAACARTQCGSDLRLLLIGRDIEPEYLRQVTSTCGMQEAIVCLGEVDDATLHSAYAAADFFALPSRYESFGLVFAEAMGHGLPVIGARTGGVPEVIDDGINGFVLDTPVTEAALADRLVRLAMDPPLRQRMGTKGRDKARTRFTWDRCAEDWEALIREVTAASRQLVIAR